MRAAEQAVMARNQQRQAVAEKLQQALAEAQAYAQLEAVSVSVGVGFWEVFMSGA